MQNPEPRRFPGIWSIIALIVAINLLIPLVLKLVPFVVGGFLLYLVYLGVTRRPW